MGGVADNKISKITPKALRMISNFIKDKSEVAPQAAALLIFTVSKL
jgi:hypothetical protein